MKKLHDKKAVLLMVLAFVMVLGLSIPQSLAYFTTYAEAAGAKQLTLERKTQHHEEVAGMEKTVTIENTGDLECWVRVKAMAGSILELKYSSESGKWEEGNDGWWYYKEILPAGKTTEPIIVSFEVKPEYKDALQDFNVTVVQECAAVHYDENNNPIAPTEERTQWGPAIESEKVAGQAAQGEGA